MTKDANSLASEHERRERHKPVNGLADRPTPRYGRLVGAVRTADLENPCVDENGQVMWDEVSVIPMGDGLLMAEDPEGLRTLINTRAYLFLEFRPNEGE